MRKLAVLLLLLPLAAAADERILAFHSDIVIRSDGLIEVTETIRVRSEGRQIRRGIYRDIPTDYYDKFGNRHEVSIEPLSVQRNNLREDFASRYADESIRIYFGHKDRYIENGVHEYRFRYRASRMLGFFEEHDELYWNVTGFKWLFPIDWASASVSFDFDVSSDDIVVDAYTGAFGDKGRDYTVELTEGPVVHFDGRSPLSATNGLTIVVAWPKGLVIEPSGQQRLLWLLKDNKNLLVALIGLLLLLAWYIPVWIKHGRDPDEGVIITRYLPPDGYSPASTRYIRQMYYDAKVMTAAVVNLAVKGYLKINNDGKDHSLTKTDPGDNAPELAAGERELYEGLFAESSHIELDDKNHKVLGEARAAHKASLKRDYKGKYFKTNGLLNIVPSIIAVLFTVLALASHREPTIPVVGLVILMYVVLVLFAVIMKRPTMRGRKLLDQLMGFRDYLEVAEKDEMNLRNPPEKTPELFELYLPFALALGVDQNWSEKFAATLAAVRGPNNETYHPAWYSGTWSNSNLSESTGGLSGGFNTAMASSVTPPGSSSGSGGGGFSGGGGGGGGGGGW